MEEFAIKTLIPPKFTLPENSVVDDFFCSGSGGKYKVNCHPSSVCRSQQRGFHSAFELALKVSIHPEKALKSIPSKFHSLCTRLKIPPYILLSELGVEVKYITSIADEQHIRRSGLHMESSANLKRTQSLPNVSSNHLTTPEDYFSATSDCVQLETEKPLNSKALEQMSVEELIYEMWATYEVLPSCLEAQLTPIVELIRQTRSILEDGGRIFILGAGTSGRLAVECSCYSPNQIIAILAGGHEALFSAQEGAEDQYTSAWIALERLKPDSKDIVLGLSASGRTPFVVGGLCIAQAHGIRTAAIACNSRSKMSEFADIAVEVPVGSELIAGSTRMKSGSVQLFLLSLIAQRETDQDLTKAEIFQRMLFKLKQQDIILQQGMGGMVKLIKMGVIRLRRGGRIVYIGNNAFGRLGVIDASEIPPTFGVDKLRVSGIIATGDPLFKSAFETSSDLSVTQQIQALRLNDKDMIVLICPSLPPGLDFAEIKQCCDALVMTIDFVDASCFDGEHTEDGVIFKSHINEHFCHEIMLKMAVKQIINIFSTAVMIQDGRVIGNRMVFMQRTNLKLRHREIQNLKSLTKLKTHQCAVLLSFFENSSKANEAFLNAKKNITE